jgi:hypothetical protein
MEFFVWPEVGPAKGSQQELVVLDPEWEMTGDTLLPLAAVAPPEVSVLRRAING